MPRHARTRNELFLRPRKYDFDDFLWFLSSHFPASAFPLPVRTHACGLSTMKYAKIWGHLEKMREGLTSAPPLSWTTPELSWTPCNRGGTERRILNSSARGTHCSRKGEISSYQSFPSNPSYIVFVVVVLNWCTWPCSLSVLVCSFGCAIGILLYKAFFPLVMQIINQCLCIYEKQKIMRLCFLWKYISDLYIEMNISLLYEF